MILDGFFPHVPADAVPARSGRAGIQELGLPYASDAAISRHIAGFLRRHAGAVAAALNDGAQAMPRPDAILLNGGVFNAELLQDRLRQVVQAWYPQGPAVRLLPHADLDLAVARGASAFGRVRRGAGVRIGGGSARSYFVGVAHAHGARALCVIPRGHPEGDEASVPHTFQLLLSRPVRFELFSSTGDAARAPGDLSPIDDELEPLPPLQTVLDAPDGRQGEVPVRLLAKLSELGTLELFLATDASFAGKPMRWKLEFALRGDAPSEGDSHVETLPARFAEGCELIEKVFGKRPMPVGPRDVKDLFRNVEKLLGPREGWSTAVCRELWNTLHLNAGRRRRSAVHERVFCQLGGYALRPGFGAPLDAWRAGEMWKLWAPGLQFHTEAAAWTEWWILWRRIAGGLPEAAHQQLFDALLPHLQPPDASARRAKSKGVVPQGPEEMVRLAASLERVGAQAKQVLGEALLARLDQALTARGGDKPFASPPVLVWALGRLGARKPFFGSAHTVIDPEVAGSWLRRLSEPRLASIESAPFALLQLARATGDRARDLPPDVRDQVAQRLEAAGAPEAWGAAVREVVQLSEAREAKIFGESLPAGLRLRPHGS